MRASFGDFKREMYHLLGKANAAFDQSSMTSCNKNFYGRDSKCIGVVMPTEESVVGSVERVFKKFGFMAFMTFNLVEQYNLEGVINITFDRNNLHQVEEAHRCINETFEVLLHDGYPPQRMSIFQMPSLKEHPSFVEPESRKAARALKSIFDPDDIIARGRYEL